MHRLLKRQLKKLFGEQSPTQAEIQELIKVVNESYETFQQDYNKLERILELSSNESFKELTNFKKAIDTAALVSLTDAQANIIIANENFCHVSGYELNELIGKNHNIINSGYHPESFFKEMWSTIGSGKIWQGEICNRAKNGSIYWVASTIIPFLNENGVPQQYLSIRFDITSRKKIEEEIKTLALVAQKTQNAVIISDAKGIAIWANEGFERITGYTLNELLGKKPGHLLQGKNSNADTIHEIRNSIKNCKPYNGELINYTKDKREYWVSLSITPLIEDGKHIGFIAIEADVTSRKNYEAKLKANELLLKAINEASAHLLANQDLDEAVLKSLRIIGNAFEANRIHIFSNDILFNKGEAAFSQKYRWDKADNQMTIDAKEYQNLSYQKLGLLRWQKSFENNSSVRAKVSELPIEEQNIFVEEGLTMIVAIPIFINEEIWGFLAVDSKDESKVWDDNDLQMLKNFAGNLASAVERHKTHLMLKSSEEKFRLLIESASDIFYYTDKRGNFTYVNDIATQITEFSTRELLHMNYLDLVLDDWKERVGHFYNSQSFSGKKVTYFEFPIKTKTGKTAWIGQNVQLIEGGNNDRGIQAIARDITSLKNAQLEIENSHNFLNEIMDATPNPMFVKNRLHEWILVNDAYTQLTGISKDKILGKRDDHFLNPSDAKDFMEMDENQFIHGTDTAREVVYKSKNNEEKILLVKKSVVKNQNDQFLIAVITDISELKERENEILLYNKISNQISDAISVADYDGKLIYVNEAHARNLDKTPKELIGSSILDMEKIFKSIDDWHNHFNSIKEKGGYLIEGENIKKDGSSFPVEANVKYINIEGKELIVAAIRDITERKIAESQIRESENRYRSLIQNATDITTVLNEKGEVMYESPAFYRSFQYEEKEVLGRSVFEFIHPNDLENTYLEFQKGLAKGGVSDPVQFRFRKKDGSYTTLETIGNNLLDEPGIRGIVVNSRDITERIKAEEDVRNLKEFYENVLNKIPSDVVVFNKDHKYLFINEIAVRDIETRKWLVGHDDYEYCEKYNKSKSIADTRRKLFNQVIESKEQLEFEEKLIKQDAGVAWVLRRYYPVIDKTGQIVTVIGFGIDITNRKYAEEKLKESEERLEEAQHIAKVAGWEITVNDKNISWSKEMYNLFDISTDIKPSLTLTYELFSRETRVSVINAFNDAIKNHKEFELEAQITTQLQKQLDVRVKAVPYLINNKTYSIKGIFQDITQEKEASRLMKQYMEELEKKNKELDQFAYVVSHDLKAPLRGINNLSMWIEEDLEGKLESDTKNNLDLMRKRVKRMEGLIDGILQYSRAGRIKHEKSTFKINSLVEDLILSLSPPENIKITVDESMPEITTERIAMEQVFSNYISNAIKYNTNPAPEIKVSCIKNGSFYEFCVADNGPGIEKEFHEKIFVIFQTLQSRDTYESTGVGLAIVKKMVEDKGGKVWIESAPGEGSKFYFSWPVTEVEE